MRLPPCAFAALAVLAAAGILLIRATLLENAYDTGTALSRSYAEEERGHLAAYETLLTFGTASLDSRLSSGKDRQTVTSFLQLYFQRLDRVLGGDVVAPYVVPYGEILGQLHGFTLALLMFDISLLALAALAWRELRSSARAERANETARVLGNIYYALYRVDYERETYEMIKGSAYVRSRIPAAGPYGDLLRAAGEVIEPDAFRDFTESFSCEKIRGLVDQQVRDFGGDFLRRFDGEYRWVSVRVLFDAALSPGEVVLSFREVEREKQRQLQERRLLEESLALARQNEDAKQAFSAICPMTCARSSTPSSD